MTRADSTRYRIVEQESELYVQVFKADDTIASGMAHDHVVRATHWSGEVRFDPERPRSCALDLEIPVAELAVDEPALRDRLGYEKEVDEGQREDVRESMLDEGQLHAARFPTLRVTAENCRRRHEGAYRADVTVTVRGESATTSTILGVDQRDDGRLRVRGSFGFRHEDFGIEPYSAFLGAVQNAQPIRFVADLMLAPSQADG